MTDIYGTLVKRDESNHARICYIYESPICFDDKASIVKKSFRFIEKFYKTKLRRNLLIY